MNFLRTVIAPSIAPLLGPGLGLALGLGLGCSAIISPDDGVERCDNVGDCADLADSRFSSECSKGGDGVPGVCVADLRSDVSCDGDVIAANPSLSTSEFALAWLDNDISSVSRYTDGCDDNANQGKAGCPGPCVDGLTVQDGICDDSDPLTPKAVPAAPAYKQADLKDQFCRSYFCDMEMACKNNTCVPCEPTADVGDGGCGSLYMNGAPSCVYTTAAAIEDGQCSAPTSSTAKVNVGVCG